MRVFRVWRLRFEVHRSGYPQITQTEISSGCASLRILSLESLPALLGIHRAHVRLDRYAYSFGSRYARLCILSLAEIEPNPLIVANNSQPSLSTALSAGQ